jgi:poly(3-hydroxybutyrate) depolymerase
MSDTTLAARSRARAKSCALGLLFALSALHACGSEDEGGECKPGASCDTGSNSVEAGAASSAARADGGASGDAAGAGSGSSGTPGAGPAANDGGGTPGARDAGQPARDAAMPNSNVDASTPIPMDGQKPSAGCGMAAPMSGNATIDIMGTQREYILTLPANYDAMKPYKLIFAWHGLGGTAQQIASNYYGLKSRSMNSVIFVSGQGLPTSAGGATGGATGGGSSGGAGWPNTGGRDVAFVKALYARLQSTLCIDENRVFSVGMSYGGIMSNTLGCQMGDVFRAIAPMSGSGPGFGGRASNCVGQVAVWLSHGDMDTTVATSSGEASRDYWAKANHCQMQTAPVEPSPCVAYTGCDAGNPVVWCEFMGGHTVPQFASAAIWTFFSQF